MPLDVNMDSGVNIECHFDISEDGSYLSIGCGLRRRRSAIQYAKKS
jgi:hypothetical protein